MTDFGSMFDQAKQNAETRRDEARAKKEVEKAEKKANLEKVMKPITEIVDPVFQRAISELKSRDVKMRVDFNSRLTTKDGERRPTKHYEFQYKGNRPGSTYNFAVYGTHTITCTAIPFDAGQYDHGSQVMHCKIEDLTPDKVEEIVKRAIMEIIV